MKVNVDTTKKNNQTNEKKSPFKLLLRGLVKNDAIVEAKSLPWYLAALCFILSILISIIPPVVSTATEKGSYVITNETYSMDVGIRAFNSFLYDNQIDIVIESDTDEEGYTIAKTAKLSMNSTSYETWKNNTESYNSSTYYYEFKINDETGALTTPRFRVFYINGDKNPSTNNTPAYDFFYNNERFGVSSKANDDPESEGYVAPTSFMVLGTHEIFIAVYPKTAIKNSDYYGTPFRGDYLRIVQTIHLHTLLLDERSSDDIDKIKVFDPSVSPIWAEPTESGWVNFLNIAYSYTRMNTTLSMFSLLSGLNALIILVYGFTLWILTRGKNNPNRDMKIADTMKISCFAAISPAILSLIIGFLIPSFASFSFILFSSFRLMWISMKTLRPME